MFWPLANLATWQCFRACACWMLLTCDNIQPQVTESYSTLQPDVTCLPVSKDVHQFHVSVPHSVLLSCRCRYQTHRPSNLGNVTEPSKRVHAPRNKPKYSASLIDNATSVCKHDVSPSKGLPRLTMTPRRARSSEQVTSLVGIHMHLQRHIRRLSWIRQHASLVPRQVSTQPLEF